MASEQALEPLGDEQDLDVGLTVQQVQALDKLAELGEEPYAGKGRYHSDPKVRALQLVAEGRLGGNQRAGRSGAKKKRASQIVSDWARDSKVEAIKDAYERALTSDSERTAMDAANRLLELENKNVEIELREHQSDIDQMDREDLIVAFLEVLNQQETQDTIKDFIPGTAEEIKTESLSAGNGFHDPEAVDGDSSDVGGNGVHNRTPSQDASGGTEGVSKARPKSLKKIKRRRAAK